MSHQDVIKHVPDAKVGQVVQDFKDDGAPAVEKTDEGNGLWTVTATFPDGSLTSPPKTVPKGV